MKTSNLRPGFVTRKQYIRDIFGEMVGYRPHSTFDPEYRLLNKNVHLGSCSDRLAAEYAAVWDVLGRPNNVVFSVYGGYISVYRIRNEPKYPWHVDFDPRDAIFRKKAKTPHGYR